MAFTIVSDRCEGIGECRSVCPVDCIVTVADATNAMGTHYSAIEPTRCTDCGACRSVCPIPGAILDTWHPDLQHRIPEPPGPDAPPPDWRLPLQAALDVAVTLGAPAGLRRKLAEAGSEQVRDVAPDLLHLAAALGEEGCCRVLLDFGFPVDERDAAGETPLVAAIHRQHPRRLDPIGRGYGSAEADDRAAAVCRLLLGAGADAQAVDGQGRAPLHHAAEATDERPTALLLAAGARFDAPDAEQRTALHIAAGTGNVGVVEVLLAAGADPLVPDGQGATPLDRALQVGDRFVGRAAALLAAADPAEPPVAALALHLAAYADDTERLGRVIADGAVLDATDPCGRTALHWAAIAGNAASVALLLGAGARADLLDSTGASAADYGRSPLHSMERRDAVAVAFAAAGHPF